MSLNAKFKEFLDQYENGEQQFLNLTESQQDSVLRYFHKVKNIVWSKSNVSKLRKKYGITAPKAPPVPTDPVLLAKYKREHNRRAQKDSTNYLVKRLHSTARTAAKPNLKSITRSAGASSSSSASSSAASSIEVSSTATSSAIKSSSSVTCESSVPSSSSAVSSATAAAEKESPSSAATSSSTVAVASSQAEVSRAEDAAETTVSTPATTTMTTEAEDTTKTVSSKKRGGKRKVEAVLDAPLNKIIVVSETPQVPRSSASSSTATVHESMSLSPLAYHLVDHNYASGRLEPSETPGTPSLFPLPESSDDKQKRRDALEKEIVAQTAKISNAKENKDAEVKILKDLKAQFLKETGKYIDVFTGSLPWSDPEKSPELIDSQGALEAPETLANDEFDQALDAAIGTGLMSHQFSPPRPVLEHDLNPDDLNDHSDFIKGDPSLGSLEDSEKRTLISYDDVENDQEPVSAENLNKNFKIPKTSGGGFSRESKKYNPTGSQGPRTQQTFANKGDAQEIKTRLNLINRIREIVVFARSTGEEPPFTKKELESFDTPRLRDLLYMFQLGKNQGKIQNYQANYNKGFERGSQVTMEERRRSEINLMRFISENSLLYPDVEFLNPEISIFSTNEHGDMALNRNHPQFPMILNRLEHQVKTGPPQGVTTDAIKKWVHVKNLIEEKNLYSADNWAETLKELENPFLHPIPQDQVLDFLQNSEEASTNSCAPHTENVVDTQMEINQSHEEPTSNDTIEVQTKTTITNDAGNEKDMPRETNNIQLPKVILVGVQSDETIRAAVPIERKVDPHDKKIRSKDLHRFFSCETPEVMEESIIYSDIKEPLLEPANNSEIAIDETSESPNVPEVIESESSESPLEPAKKSKIIKSDGKESKEESSIDAKVNQKGDADSLKDKLRKRFLNSSEKEEIVLDDRDEQVNEKSVKDVIDMLRTSHPGAFAGVPETNVSNKKGVKREKSAEFENAASEIPAGLDPAYKTLIGDQWIGSFVVDDFIRRLCVDTNVKAIESSTFDFQKPNLSKPEELIEDIGRFSDYLSTLFIRPGDTLLFPVVYSEHWLLIEVKVEISKGFISEVIKMKIHDSLEKDDVRRAMVYKRASKLLKPFIIHLLRPNDAEEYMKKVTFVIEPPQWTFVQKGYRHCAFFTILSAYCVVKNIVPEKDFVPNVEEIRSKIINFFITKTLQNLL